MDSYGLYLTVRELHILRYELGALKKECADEELQAEYSEMHSKINDLIKTNSIDINRKETL